MSRRGSFAIGLLFVVFVAFTALTLAGLHPEPRFTGRVLAPLPPSEQGTAVADTNIADLRIRRVCSDGRCQLFARDGGAAGYELLASYQDNACVRIARGPSIQVTDARCPRARPAPVVEALIALFSAALLFAAIRFRSSSLAGESYRFDRARPAVADEHGALTFEDRETPERATSAGPVAAGPVTALYRVEDRHTLGGGPFRETDSARYEVVAGARGDHLLAIANARGRNRMLGLIAIGLAVGAVVFTVLDGR